MNKTYSKIIALIGPRSVGKTTIGKELAKENNITFVDFDNYCNKVLKKQGKQDIGKFIETLKLERKITTELAWKEFGLWLRKVFKEFLELNKKNSFVLDLGGGTLSEDLEDEKVNAPLLKKYNAKIILLLPNENEEKGINKLLLREKQREHWIKANWTDEKLLQKTKKDYYYRIPIFKQFADIIIYLNDKKITEIINEINHKLIELN
jgi:shikimate kinase